jgi:hypothetical protein
MQPNRVKKGSIIKLFGVVLIFLGALDSMRSWRGGFPASDFYFWLIACGLLLYGVGAIRRCGRSGDPRLERGG